MKVGESEEQVPGWREMAYASPVASDGARMRVACERGHRGSLFVHLAAEWLLLLSAFRVVLIFNSTASEMGRAPKASCHGAELRNGRYSPS